MRLLVSIKTSEEVRDAIEGGADIIDVKDPSDGSLGLPDLDVVRDVIRIAKSVNGKELSIALGDLGRASKSLKYIAFSVGMLGVDYVKVGLALKDTDEAQLIARSVDDVLRSFSSVKLVLVGYADYRYTGTVEPMKVIDIATRTSAKGVMIDTLKKNGQSTFDLIEPRYFSTFTNTARKLGLFTAIAGSIRLQHLSMCRSLGFDVVGVRGAVCNGGRSGRISRDLVKLFRREIDRLCQKNCDVHGMIRV
uniref:(5-formylfuran-3-yl)methyl phosphate synthase n=1 Tax=Ignisphaera aggregans TaxID=334771 RepID=A0A7C2V9F3_9CREN